MTSPFQTAGEMATEVRTGRKSAVELTRAAIARIEALDGSLNAVPVRDFERAMAEARAFDAKRDKTGPLAGVPMTVKEAINVAGLATTWGVAPPKQAVAVRDATVVARLRAAGAIVLGKSNIATMLADWQTANPIYGVTSNPWNTARTPGGSSGGGAAAVAAGFAALEVGSDMASSLRLPASHCGVYAHKPSYGLLPMRGFAPPGTPDAPITPNVDLSVLGPMARSAEDLDLALELLAGPDEADAGAYRLELPPARHGRLADFRVLVVAEHPLSPTAASVRGALEDLAARLGREGATVANGAGRIPDMTAIAEGFVTLMAAFGGADMPADAHGGLQAAVMAHPGEAHDLQALNQRGLVLSHRDWIQADRARVAIANQWRRLFKDWDVVLCPAAPTTAIAHDRTSMDQRRILVDSKPAPYGVQPLWASLASLAGLPATVAPNGRDAEGLPIGVQIIGPRLEDRTSIRFGGLIGQAFGGFTPPPRFA